MLSLHSFEHLSADDGLVIVLYEILRKFAVILFAGFGNVVGDVGLLEKKVTDVFFVLKNTVNCCCGPLSAKAGRSAFFKKDVCNGLLSVAFQIQPEDAADIVRVRRSAASVLAPYRGSSRKPSIIMGNILLEQE